MKRRYLPLLIVSILTVSSTQCTDLSTPPEEGKISVYVHWQEDGIPGKKVEIIQTGATQYTDERGIAEFSLPPGSYIVRVYDINRGGPCCGYVDYNVTLKTSAKESLDVVDCLPCV